MDKLKKLIFVTFCIIIALGLFFIASFLAVNLWPRKMPDELWNGEVITNKIPPGKNAWSQLHKIDERTLSWPFNIYPFEVLGDDQIVNSATSVSIWQKIQKHRKDIQFDTPRKNDLLSKRKWLLSFPEFVEIPEEVLQLGPNSLFLSELNKIGIFYVMSLSLSNKWDEAYSFLIKQIEHDYSWSTSALTTPNIIVSKICLMKDLQTLSLLLYQNPIIDISNVNQIIQKIDTDKIDFKKVLIKQYRDSLAHIMMVNPKEYRTSWNKIRTQLLFNVKISVIDLNDVYATYAYYVDNRIPMPSGVQKSIDSRTESYFWWFKNPLGKTLELILRPFLTGPFNQHLNDLEFLNLQLNHVKEMLNKSSQ